MVVTWHAVRRARERYDPRLTAADVRRDVEAAIREGRDRVRPPREIRFARTRRHEGCRYVWTEALDHCYLVRRVRSRDAEREPIVVVITALMGVGGAA